MTYSGYRITGLLYEFYTYLDRAYVKQKCMKISLVTVYDFDIFLASFLIFVILSGASDGLLSE